ncbi:MFS transporter [Luteipulveratus mongoliensis]|uniref:MFS transporter n=1 Tax=Luteipulveratus mongoliensis TaxID=571913 RepID=A0A0K1JR09_9MICO|nr:MFS transporter [Luteipulveratus mongoliensis]
MAYAQTLTPSEQDHLQRRWYWYDWANSAYATTIAAVLISPYLTAVAKESACPGIEDGQTCHTNLNVLGVGIAPGSLAPFTITVSTLISAVVLIFIGAVADRSEHPTRLLGIFSWAGALTACMMFFISGTNWQLGVVLIILANVFFGASMIVYDALLIRIAPPDDRDRVSSRGWAFGYLGGGILLALNLVLLSLHDTLGISEGMSVRISLLSAGLWWAGFAIIPVLGLASLRGTVATPVERSAGVVRGSITQLATTFRELKHYPQTLSFLLAYLFFNDGIQTVIGSASLYGKEQLKFSDSQLVQTILLVQFVAFGGALLFGRLAREHGAKKLILWGLGLWVLVVLAAFFLPERAFMLWLALGLAIGIVLGGTQALSRSLYSQLIPRGRESEFFSLYQAMERGTSWFGTLLFGLVYQFAHSYRLSIVALMVFFVLGGYLLSKCDIREGIRAAGNQVPRVV